MCYLRKTNRNRCTYASFRMPNILFPVVKYPAFQYNSLVFNVLNQPQKARININFNNYKD